jgi:hypothetical protein
MSRPPTRNPRIPRIASVHHVCPVCHIFRPMRCVIYAYLCFPLTYATYVRSWGAYAGRFGAYSPAYVTCLTNVRGLTTFKVHLHVFYAYLCLSFTYDTYARCCIAYAGHHPSHTRTNARGLATYAVCFMRMLNRPPHQPEAQHQH